MQGFNLTVKKRFKKKKKDGRGVKNFERKATGTADSKAKVWKQLTTYFDTSII